MTPFYKGRAKRIDDVDLPRIGAQIGVGEDVIHAFMDVEAAGSGFDEKGRVKMLFEPHVFWKELGPGIKRDDAASRGIAYAKWKKEGYPSDSYPRFITAMKIDEAAALNSASWGLGQIMGFNHKLAGYNNAKAMVKDFADDEENGLQAMVNFIKAKGLDDELRAHNWVAVEYGYNGGGHGGAYARKMAESYAKWKAIKDTPYDPEEIPPPEVPIPPVADAETVQVPPSRTPDQKKLTIQKAMIWIVGAIAAVITALFFGR